MWKIIPNHLSIAISGLSGCGNTSASKLLAQQLQIQFINYTFRNLAVDLKLDFNELHNMADKDDKWDIMVDNKQIEYSAEQSCVVGSRLAIWKIASAKLKVYLEASEEVRAQRIFAREGGDMQEVFLATKKRDKVNCLRYQRIYQIDVNAYQEQADIILNVNTITVEEVVEQILNSLLTRQLIINQ